MFTYNISSRTFHINWPPVSSIIILSLAVPGSLHFPPSPFYGPLPISLSLFSPVSPLFPVLLLLFLPLPFLVFLFFLPLPFLPCPSVSALLTLSFSRCSFLLTSPYPCLFLSCLPLVNRTLAVVPCLHKPCFFR